MSMLTSNFKPTPYWWDTAELEQDTHSELPKSVDVLIVGAGYTGLHAALQTARAGLSTYVLDAEVAGFGASTRNGGQISTSIKPTFAMLQTRYGTELATSILKEGQASLDFIKHFVAQEEIECDFRVPGRFHGAHTAQQYEKLARYCDTTGNIIKTDAYVVPRQDQHKELGTEEYFGGAVFPHHASVNPARYHQGLLHKLKEAGATVVSRCPVTALERQTNGFLVSTAKGQMRAGKVIIATNGYTGPLTPHLQRRVIPIGSYIIATEPVPSDVMDQVMPTNRILSDTRKLVYYYRPSPDRKRILFGGRVSLRETDPLTTGTLLRNELVRLFPMLRDVQVSHSWTGFVGYTFDSLMHTGHENGLYHAMGYCGAGVGMSSYLGMRIGEQAAGKTTTAGAFDNIPFPTRPFYKGNPWFLATSVFAYRIRDRLGI